MHRSHTCGELRAQHIGQTVTLSGWVQRSRDLGGMTFVDLRDRYGITQLAFNMETHEALCLEARKWGREFVIKATGTVIERHSKNAQMPTGDIEIQVTSFELLNASKTPPFTIEDESDGGDDLRMQWRFCISWACRSAATTSRSFLRWRSRRPPRPPPNPDITTWQRRVSWPATRSAKNWWLDTPRSALP